jgi:hypothetical protein
METLLAAAFAAQLQNPVPRASGSVPWMLDGPVRPVAVVAMSVPLGQARAIRPFLAGLARSRGAGDVPVASGAFAVLLLGGEPDVIAAAEPMMPNYPFPLRIETGSGDAAFTIRCAAAWATALGAEGIPVLLAEAGRPVAPRWAYEALVALQDGADLVMRRTGLLERLLAGPVPPFALSSRAQHAVETWAERAGRGAVWAGRDSPWRRPAAAGLRAVPV